MSNDSQNWKLLQDLFHLAEETPEVDRERVLAEHCPDPTIRRRAMEIFFSASLTEDPPRSSESVLIGRRFGPYKLLRHIGSGGIGAVYLAERMLGGSPQRSALKVLAPHAAGSSFVERFHREQHILASLEHPNITRLLDAGLTEVGEPYLVMEYVDGWHIDSYCDERKLSVEARLQLFLRVCDAVAYAHRNLIVHLDLKPSNILVTADGTVKLLDFGTSKLIQPDSMLTTTIMATPAYASPEQLRNEPVTTACDIYSLGAILFELLSGHRPNSESSMAAMIERAMREEEPERLADRVSAKAAESHGLSEVRLRQMLTGDLATIVAKCLSARPENRYASVDALSKDVEYFFEGRPILARPLTTRYRLGKFIRRHRTGAAATVLVTLLVAGSLSYAEWRQRQAILEGRRAEHMQTFMYSLFKLANSNYTGKPAATVPEFLELGVKLLPDYITDPADLRQAQISLAESMFDNDDLVSAQKVFTQTIASAKAANDINAETEAEAFSGNIAYLQGNDALGKQLTTSALALSRKPGVSATARVWSAVYYAYNQENEGFHSDENVRLYQFALQECRDKHLSKRETTDVLFLYGEDLELRGELSQAIDIFNQALAIYGTDPSTLCEQSAAYGEIAFAKDQSGAGPAVSLPLYQRAYEGAAKCSGRESRGAITQLDFVAFDLIKLGRAAEALPMLEGIAPAWEKMAGNTPEIAEFLFYLAMVYNETGHYPEAEKTASRMAAVQEGKVSPTDRRIGASHLMWGQALAGQGKYREALPHAVIADRLLVASAHSAGAKKMGADAHALLLRTQSELAK